jgi:hypothetical protein
MIAGEAPSTKKIGPFDAEDAEENEEDAEELEEPVWFLQVVSAPSPFVLRVLRV